MSMMGYQFLLKKVAENIWLSGLYWSKHFNLSILKLFGKLVELQKFTQNVITSPRDTARNWKYTEMIHVRVTCEMYSLRPW